MAGDTSPSPSAPANQPPPARLYFRPRHRLTHAREFQAVYDARLSRVRGPLVVHALATERTLPRLGLSIGKRAGNAVVRGRLKRFIREAFRLHQFALRPGTDFIVGVRGSAATLKQPDVARAFLSAAEALAQVIEQRRSPPPAAT
ncbi:MAG: ribonuclease P protein component [Phycisphaerales bacterium]